MHECKAAVITAPNSVGAPQRYREEEGGCASSRNYDHSPARSNASDRRAGKFGTDMSPGQALSVRDGETGQARSEIEETTCRAETRDQSERRSIRRIELDLTN